MSELEGYVSVGRDLYCGVAWQKEITSIQDDEACDVVEIIFEPGSFTRWHSHSGYQVIMVTGGEGFYQEKGSVRKWVNVGDVIKIKPGACYMHSTSQSSTLTHTAITFNHGPNVVTLWKDKIHMNNK